MTRRFVLHTARQPIVVAGTSTLLAALLALLATGAVWWHPAFRRHNTLERHNAVLMAELKELKLRQEMAELYQKRSGEVSALEEKLALARSEPEFVAAIEKLAAGVNTELLQFSSRPTPKSAKTKDTVNTDTTVFEFFISGDYAGLKMFLAGLRDLPEFVAVERVVFERIDPAIRARILLKRRTARKA